MKESFILRTAELARAAPTQWSQFLQEFDRFVNDSASKLIHQTPPELVHVNQGVVRGISELYNDFCDIMKTADKVSNKTKGT